MATRRRFMALLGVGAASAPLAAKAAADAEIAKLANLPDVSGLGFSGGGVSGGGAPGPSSEGLKYLPWDQRVQGFHAYVKATGHLPAFMDAMFREQARTVYALDPDIAAKRSWSMAVKIQEQRQRNYQRMVASVDTTAVQTAKRTALQKLLGFELPW